MRPIHLLFVLLLTSVSALASPLPTDFEEQIIARLDTGTYEETIGYIQTALAQLSNQQDTSYALGLYWLGIVHYEYEEYDAAISSYQKAYDIYATSIDQHFEGMIQCRNELGLIADDMGDTELAIQYFEEVLTLQQKYYSNDIEQSGQTYQWLSSLYNDATNYTKSIAIGQEHIQQLRATGSDLGIPFIQASSNLGSSLQSIGNFSEAEIVLKEALQTAKDKEINTKEVILLLNNLAALYIETNRQNEALPFYQQAVARQKQLNKNTLFLATLLSNLANCNNKLKKHALAKKQLQEALEISHNTLGESHINSIAILNNLGGVYEEKKQYVTASIWYKRAIELANINYQRHPFMGIFKSNLAACYEKEKAYTAALELYHQVLDLFLSLNPNSNRVSQTYNDIARVYWRQKSDLNKGIDLVYKSLSLNVLDEPSIERIKDDLSIVVSRNLKSYNNTNTALGLLSSLQQTMYMTTKDNAWLEAALTTRTIQAQCTRKYKSTVTNTKDQLKIASKIARTSRNALKIIELLHTSQPDDAYLEMALNFAELNKSAVLAGALQESQAFKFGNLPDHLRQQEKELKITYNATKKALIEATNNDDTTAIHSAQETLIDLEFQQGQFQKELEQTYPKYSAYKYDQQQLTIKEIQTTLLDEKTALLEYFMYDTSAYLLVITNDQTQLLPLALSVKSAQKQIQRLRQGLSNYALIGNDEQRAFILYTAAAYQLYQALIEPATPFLSNRSRLIIIPDADLGNIPFEVLLEKPSNQKSTETYNELAYLVKRYDISYSYSTALLLGNKKNNQRQNNGKILGFAAAYSPSIEIPSFRSKTAKHLRGQLNPLPAAKEEVIALEAHFPTGDYFYDKDANEANFKQYAADYSILHLAMHGLLNAQQPLLSALVFTENNDSLENNFLEAYEISNLALHNDLVVLSACETGFGRFAQGEGVLSLARSFMYAGTPSLLVSLWQVNDNSTAVIMRLFYENLQLGMAKDKALAEAKRYYLEHTSGLAAHPAFWSPFIQLGDNAPIALNDGHKNWYIILIAVIGLLVAFVLYSKRAR